jgi:His/Glu/Gln/Arg/opine family amino acid ABC transporter permease subunit
MKLDFLQIVPSIPFILGGVVVTLKYMLISVFLGLILGTLLSLMKVSHVYPLKVFAQAYTSLFRGTPLLVQLMLVYHCTPQLTGYNISAFEAGVIAFSLNAGAYISEIIRSGIQAVDGGQFEAFKSLGISYKDGMKDIILPQAFKNILPGLINEMVDLLKESSLVSVIGEMDLLRRANIVAAEKYIYFEPLLFIAAIYYILVMALTTLARRVELWMARSDRH